MQITFTPQRRSARPEIVRQGDTLIIDGDKLDLSPIPDGATLPAEAIPSDWINGAVERIDGELHVPLVLAIGPGAPEASCFPEPVTLTGDGPVPMPPFEQEPSNAD